MLERHEIEQFFWDDATLSQLAARICERTAPAEAVCCLCAPFLGRELARRGRPSRVLDIDERFAQDRGFERFDLFRPAWRDGRFGLIVCDPPFWKVSLSQLFAAVRVLAHHDWEQPLLFCYPQRRGTSLCGTFARFGLAPLPSWRAGYRTLPEAKREGKWAREGIIFFSNVREWIEESTRESTEEGASRTEEQG